MAFELRLAQDADAERLLKVINAAFRQAESHIIDRDHVEAQWQFYENGGPKMTESFQYTRVR